MKKIRLIHPVLIGLLLMGLCAVWAAVPVTAATGDTTSVRSITLHKYTQGATTSTAPVSGTTADAAQLRADNLPIQGVRFQVTRITKVSGQTLSASDPSSYTTDPTFTALTVTTDSDGQAVAVTGTGTAGDGWYLVTELSSALVTTAAAPFIVHLPQVVKAASTGTRTITYDVNVYPKNVLDADAVALNPVKTVQDAAGNGVAATSVMTGAFVLWNLTVTRPADIMVTADDGTVRYAKQLVMSDPIVNSTLKYIGYDVAYFLAPDGTKTTVTAAQQLPGGNDLAGIAQIGQYTVNYFGLSDAGIKAFAAQPAGTKLIFPVATTVTPDATGKIINTFDTFYQGTATTAVIHEHSGTPTPLQDGATDITAPTLPTAADTNAPIVYTGNVDVLKTDEDGKPLANATFELFTSEAAAKAGTSPVTSGPDINGKSQALQVTTDANGSARFVGLKVDPSSQTQTYYLVETDAPAGYDVSGQVYKVTAARDTTVDATVVDHDNLWPNLPLTGRNGQLLLYAVSGTLILAGAVGGVWWRRRTVGQRG